MPASLLEVTNSFILFYFPFVDFRVLKVFGNNLYRFLEEFFLLAFVCLASLAEWGEKLFLYESWSGGSAHKGCCGASYLGGKRENFLLLIHDLFDSRVPVLRAFPFKEKFRQECLRLLSAAHGSPLTPSLPANSGALQLTGLSANSV